MMRFIPIGRDFTKAQRVAEEFSGTIRRDWWAGQKAISKARVAVPGYNLYTVRVSN